MKLFSLILFLLISVIAPAQEDTVSSLKIKKNVLKQRIEGIATVAGLYDGALPVDTFLKEDRVVITQDSGRLGIVSYEVSYSYRGVIQTLASNSEKFPPELKDAIRLGGSWIEFDNIKAKYRNGITVVLNPIKLRLLDNAPNAGSKRQAEQKGLATINGIYTGQVRADTLLNHAVVEIQDVAGDVTLSSYTVSFISKGQLVSLPSYNRTFPIEIITLIKQTSDPAPDIYVDNIQVKHKDGTIDILNPIHLKLIK